MAPLNLSDPVEPGQELEETYLEVTITPRMTERDREAAIARALRGGQAVSER